MSDQRCPFCKLNPVSPGHLCAPWSCCGASGPHMPGCAMQSPAAQKPSVGRIVHYLGEHEREPQAAIVTKVCDNWIEVMVFPPRQDPDWAWEVPYVETAKEGFRLLRERIESPSAVLVTLPSHYWTWPPKI